MNWEMDFADFVKTAEMFESKEEHPAMEEEIYFSLFDAGNNCEIDEQEAEQALEALGVPEKDMDHVMGVLGDNAGEDLKMNFAEFKAAVKQLREEAPGKLKLKMRRFSMKKKHMGRKLMKLLRSQAA